MFHGYPTDDTSAFSRKRSLEVVSGPKWLSFNSDFGVKRATVASKNFEGGPGRSKGVGRLPNTCTTSSVGHAKRVWKKKKQQKKKTTTEEARQRTLRHFEKPCERFENEKREKGSVQKEDVATLDTMSCAWKAESGNSVRCAPHKTQFCTWRFNRQIEIQPKNVFKQFPVVQISAEFESVFVLPFFCLSSPKFC